MTDRDDHDTEAAFDQRARDMIVAYQDAKGLKDWEMAVWFGNGITEDNYQSYKRRRFPAYLIWWFCKYTGSALDGVPVEGAKHSKRPTERPRIEGARDRRADRIIKKKQKEQDKNDKSSAD